MSRVRGRVLVVACGALARELRVVLAANRLADIDVAYLSAELHNTPQDIPVAVEERLAAARDRYDRLFVAYGDCGTGGALDSMLDRYGAERLPGAHCYEFFAGSQLFAQLHDAEPTTFYLTDFLLRQFDRLVWRGLGLDRWPHLRDDYFGNYTRLLYLSQLPPSDDQLAAARRAAERLGLRLEHRHVGMGDVTPALRVFVEHRSGRVREAGAALPPDVVPHRQKEPQS